ncbi:hypothetical protein MLD38_006487 [Melastoma candidum]|uniref:Uncharacterized protein n=1 Tax=Melastoma candidum TaxID=119954 RepID=A0ACB9RMP9_9MYRT|nr:hypothetical protein MLD38_006487 [Melastoma candidum]
MQGIRRHDHNSLSSDPFQLGLSPTSSPPSASASAAAAPSPSSLSIDDNESTEERIQRLIAEHPVVIFSRPSCCMCHVMKNLLVNIGVHPAVIELEDHEVSALGDSSPSAFIGGSLIGGLDSLVGLHLSGRLVPRLVEVGALHIAV